MPPNTVYDTFAVTFAYECHSDTLTMTSTAGNLDLDYTLGTGTSTVSSAIVSHTYPLCPLTVSLEVYLSASGTWIAHDDASSAISPAISSFDANTGSFDVSTSSTAFAPSTTFAMRETYTSTDSLDTDGTFVDYFSIVIRNDCSDGVLSQTTLVSDQTYVDSATAATVSPAYTFSRDSADCPLTAVLSIYDSSTNTWEVYSSGAGNPDHTWVSSFSSTNTPSNLDAGETSIYLVGASAFKPETTFQVKIEVANLDADDPTPLSYEFDVTIVDFCRGSALTFSTS